MKWQPHPDSGCVCACVCVVPLVYPDLELSYSHQVFTLLNKVVHSCAFVCVCLPDCPGLLYQGLFQTPHSYLPPLHINRKGVPVQVTG